MLTIRPHLAATMSGSTAWRADERPAEVDRHHPIPLLVGDLGELAELLDAGVVDQDQHRAEVGSDLRHGGFHRGTVRDVDDIAGDLRAFAAQAVDLYLDLIGGDVEYRDLRATRGECLGDGQAEASGTAGDDGGGVFEPHVVKAPTRIRCAGGSARAEMKVGR